MEIISRAAIARQVRAGTRGLWHRAARRSYLFIGRRAKTPDDAAHVVWIEALLLASIGLYGVLGFSFRSVREIRLRMAVGAEPGKVFRQVFRHGVGMTIGGVAASLLFGVKQWDPLTFVAAAALLLIVAALAIGAPSRHATLVDPISFA